MSRHTRGLRAGYGRLAALVTAIGVAALTGCGSQPPGAAPQRPGAASPGGRSAGYGLAGSASQYRGPVQSGAGQTSGGAQAAKGTRSGVSGGALFGGNFPVVSLEPKLGRKLGVVRLYYFLGDAFPGPWKYRKLLVGGRTVQVSLDSKGASYASIAAGEHDAAISKFLKAVNQAAIRYNLGSIYFTFEHEPDNESHRALGAPVQFIQAWDHVHHLAESEHLDWNDGGRLHWVLVLIHSTYGNWRSTAFWPGSSEVDIAAADGYNSFGCGSGGQGGQQTPADTFGPLLKFAAAHGGPPVFLAEWGSDDIPAGIQATYINQMHSYVAKHKAIAGVMYWDTHVGNCNYKVDDNPGSISALAKMGKSAALQGHV